MTAFLDDLLSAVRKPAIDNRERLHRLVRQLAAGDAPKSADDVREILDATSTSEADLRRAVEVMRQRLADEAVIAEESAVAKREAEARKRLEAAQAAFERAEEKFFETAGPLEFELRLCRDTFRAIDNAKQRLRETCIDPAITGRMAELRDEREALTRAAGEISARITRLRLLLADAESRSAAEEERIAGDRKFLRGQRDNFGHPLTESMVSGAALDESRRTEVRLRESIQQTAGQLGALRQRLDAITAEETDLRNKMLRA